MIYKSECVIIDKMPRVKEGPAVEKTQSSPKVSRADLTPCVDADKLRRARLAVEGKAKPDTAEVHLAAKLRGKYGGDALILEIYKGLKGLYNVTKAAKNRENEKKAAQRRASR